MFIKANGRTGKPTVSAFFVIPKAVSIRASGATTYSTAKAPSYGITMKFSIRVISLKVKRLERANLNLMEAVMMVNFWMDNSMGKASITLLIQAEFISVNFTKTKFKAKES